LEAKVGKDPVLEADNLVMTFDGLTAVDGVSLAVPSGGLHAIIGSNGAGKTTLFNLLSCQFRPSSGRVILRGRDITGTPRHRVSRLGLGRSFQTPDLFGALPVVENVRLAVHAGHRQPFGRPRSVVGEALAAEDILGRLGMAERAGDPVATLSYGDKRKLELGLLLALDTDVMLLDEPTAGVAREDIPALIDLIRSLHAEHRTIVLVEHNMDVVMTLSEHVWVLDRGLVIAHGTPRAVMADERVQVSYVGTSV
jgi:branched-chain amino acid transport system ATP-binding protein